MLGLVLPITAIFLWIYPSGPAPASSQQPPPKAQSPSSTTPPAPPKPDKPPVVPTAPKPQPVAPTGPVSARVIVDKLPIHDGADNSSYISGSLERGDRVRVRKRVADSWLAIDAPDSIICWIERSAIQPEADPAALQTTVNKSNSPVPHRARVVATQAIIRSGHPDAKLPGPPISTVEQGTMVTLVDRPPLTIGQGPAATTWFAMAPLAGQLRYVSAAGTDWTDPETKTDRVPRSPRR